LFREDPLPRTERDRRAARGWRWTAFLWGYLTSALAGDLLFGSSMSGWRFTSIPMCERARSAVARAAFCGVWRWWS